MSFTRSDERFLKAGAISLDEPISRSQLQSAIESAARDREVEYIKTIRELNARLRQSLAREEQWVAWRKQACEERDQANRRADRWRRNLLWIALPQAIALAAGAWGFIFGRLWK